MAPIRSRIFGTSASLVIAMPAMLSTMSPRTTISRPPIVAMRSPPCRPISHAGESLGTMLTREPLPPGTLRDLPALRPDHGHRRAHLPVHLLHVLRLDAAGDAAENGGDEESREKRDEHG